MEPWQLVLFSIFGNSTVLAVLGLLGKSLVTGVIQRDIEKFRSQLQRSLEEHKVRLKKSEFLFQKEFEATSELVMLKTSLSLNRNQPDMDFENLLENVAHDFPKITIQIKSYLMKHGAILNEEVKELLQSSYHIAAEGQAKLDDPEISSELLAEANKLYEKIDSAEILMMQQVRSQSTT
jgi:hypothetical protein